MTSSDMDGLWNNTSGHRLGKNPHNKHISSQYNLRLFCVSKCVPSDIFFVIMIIFVCSVPNLVVYVYILESFDSFFCSIFGDSHLIRFCLNLRLKWIFWSIFVFIWVAVCLVLDIMPLFAAILSVCVSGSWPVIVQLFVYASFVLQILSLGTRPNSIRNPWTLKPVPG